MAHVREEAVLCLIEHLDLLMLTVRGNDFFLQAVLRVEHDDTHDQLEHQEHRKVYERLLSSDMFLRIRYVDQNTHARIRNRNQADILQRLKINAYRNHQGDRQEDRRINI